MAAIDVEFDVSELQRALRRYQTRNRNLPMDAFANLLINEVEDVFETKGGSGTAGSWEPFRPSTLERHPRRVGGMILQDTGATANIQVMRVEPQAVEIGSPTVQAPFFLSGTRNMVKRDFFALNFPKVLAELGDLVLQEFQRT